MEPRRRAPGSARRNVRQIIPRQRRPDLRPLAVASSMGAVASISDRVGDLGGYLREQREHARLSVRQLATLAGVSNPYLSQVERGLRNPSAEVLQQIARGLRISAEALYVRAGILEEQHRPGVEDAVNADAVMTDRQKRVLLDIYAAFCTENARAARDALGDGEVPPPRRSVRVRVPSRQSAEGATANGTADQRTTDQGTADQGTADQGTADQGTVDRRTARRRAAGSAAQAAVQAAVEAALESASEPDAATEPARTPRAGRRRSAVAHPTNHPTNEPTNQPTTDPIDRTFTTDAAPDAR
jgi:transcriptional regulator with XRE-family HTH domain